MRGVKNQIPNPFKQGRSPYYWFKYYDSKGIRRTRSTGKTTIRDAREYISEFIKLSNTDILTGELTFLEYSKPFFKDPNSCPVLQRIIEKKGTVSSGTCVKWLGGLRKIVGHKATNNKQEDYPRQPIADLKINQITFYDIETMFDRLRETQSYHTLLAMRQALSSILDHAVRNKHILANPMKGQKLTLTKKTKVYTPEEILSGEHDQEDEKGRAFTLDELAQLWKHRKELVTRPTGEVYSRDLAYLVLLFMGMRNGEARGLQWKHIDLETGKLSIVQSAKKDYTNSLKIGPPKTKKVRKDLPIPPCILEELKNYRVLKKAEANILVNPTSFVIHDDRLGPLSYTTVYFLWNDVIQPNLEKIGLEHQKHLTAHAMRRTVNTALKNFFPIGHSAVDYYLGWSDTKKNVGDTHYLQQAQQVEGLQNVAKVLDRIIQGNPPRIEII